MLKRLGLALCLALWACAGDPPPATTGVLPDSPVASEAGSPAVSALRGKATWYDASKNWAWYTQPAKPHKKYYHQDTAPYEFYAAAGPRMLALWPFHWGGEPYQIFITNPKTKRTIIAWVVDTCGCVGGGIVDLAPAAFKALGVRLGIGIQTVVVSRYYRQFAAHGK